MLSNSRTSGWGRCVPTAFGTAALCGAALLGVWGAGGCSRTTGESATATAARGLLITGPLSATGRIELSGALARTRDGGVALRLVEQDSGRVLLQRIYDLGDPLWTRRDDGQSLYFALGPEHEFDSHAPAHAPLVLEAIHLPATGSGEPQANDPRVSIAVEARSSERELSLRVDGAVAASEQSHAPSHLQR